MKQILLILILFPYQIIAQNKSNIKADNNFNCSNYTFVDPIYGLGTFLDSVYNISNICDSKNSIEIRFTTSYAPTQILDIVILTYNNNTWECKKYEFNTDTIYNDSVLNASYGKIIVSSLKAQEGFDKIFSKLKMNNIFSLPNEKDIKGKLKGPTCGIMHSLTYKVDNSYRTYKFNNPQYYVDHTKNKIFRNYYNIAEILSKGLQKE